MCCVNAATIIAFRVGPLSGCTVADAQGENEG